MSCAAWNTASAASAYSASSNSRASGTSSLRSAPRSLRVSSRVVVHGSQQATMEPAFHPTPSELGNPAHSPAADSFMMVLPVLFGLR